MRTENLGTPIDDDDNPGEGEPGQNRKTRFLVLAAVLTLVGGFVALGLNGHMGNKSEERRSSYPDASTADTTASSQTSSVPPETLPTPVPEVPDFELIFHETFNRPASEGNFLKEYPNWFAYPGWKDTSKRGTYELNNLSVQDDKLSIRVRTQHGRPTGAAPQPKIHQIDTYNQLYGRYEVKFRADRVEGYHMAWLLWPKSEEWPEDGEIDYPEGNLDGTFSGFVHWQGGKNFNSQKGFSGIENDGQWHVAVTEWRPGNVKFFLDDRLIGETSLKIPNTPMRWVLQTESSQDVKASQNASGVIEVDYARVWKYVG